MHMPLVALRPNSLAGGRRRRQPPCVVDESERGDRGRRLPAGGTPGIGLRQPLSAVVPEARPRLPVWADRDAHVVEPEAVARPARADVERDLSRIVDLSA